MVKNTPKFTHRKHLEAPQLKKKVWLMVLLSLILSMGLVSALSFDNVQKYDKVKEEITITNAFGFGDDIATYTLISNTYQCLINCDAVGTAKLFEEGYLFTGVEFENLKGKNVNIKKYDIFIEVTEETSFENPIYDIITKELTNYETVYETKTSWKLYDNEILDAGLYKWKIKGTKDKNEAVDFIASAFGEKLKSWAWWSSTWSKRKQVNITGGGSVLNNFTVLINVTYDASMKSDFADLRFVNGSCSGAQTDELDYQVDFVDASTSALVWIRIPNLGTGTNEICMYYNNPIANSGDDGKDAWDTGYVGIWHFSNASGATNQDTITGNVYLETASPVYMDSDFGLGTMVNFTTSDGIILPAANISIDVTGRPVVVEAWVSSPVTNNQRFISSSTNGYGVGYGSDTDLGWTHSGVLDITGADAFLVAGTNYSYQATHIVNDVSWYINGESDADNPQALATGYTSVDYDIGKGSSTWAGAVDELKISNVTRSSDWLNRSRQNQNFSQFTFDAEELGSLSVSLNYPLDNHNNLSTSINFNCSASTPLESLSNITLWTNSSGTFQIENYTTGLTGVSNSTTFIDSFTSVGNYLWNCQGCNATSCAFGSNRTLTIDSISENSQTFNATTSEFSQENFRINITYSDLFSSVVANLVYNGTSYLGTNVFESGKDITFSRNIDIPSIAGSTAETRPFYWEIALSGIGSARVNSSFNNQTIDPLFFTICNATYPSPIYVNYTVYDENNLSLLNVSFDATFSFGIGGSTDTKNVSFDISDSLYEYLFCTNTNKTFIVDANIELTKSGYFPRTFFLDDESYTNTSTTLTSFFLSPRVQNGTNIIIAVTDSGLQPLENYVVKIDRYYTSDNTYRTIISEKTDEFGQFATNLIENDVKYKFRFFNPSGVLVKTTQDVTIACRTSICVLPFVIEDTTDVFDPFDDVTDFDYTLSYSNVTNNITATWNDVTGDIITMRLFVKRILINGTTTICNVSSTLSLGNLVCDTGGIKASYGAQLFRTELGETEKRITILNFKIGEDFKIYGKEGLFWGFILLFTLIAVGVFSPVAAVILYLFGFIIFGFLGIFSFNFEIVMANILLVVIFIWAWVRR